MAKIITSATPRELGYRMPAEWEKQTAVWLQWPEKYLDSNQQNRLSYQMKLEKTWLLMTWELHRHVRVCILAQSEKHRDHIFTTMDYFGFDMSRVEIHITHMADVWHRDSGPIFVVNNKGDLVLIPAFGNANDVKAQAVLVECYPDRTMVPISVVSLTAEGGAIHCVTQHQPAALGNKIVTGSLALFICLFFSLGILSNALAAAKYKSYPVPKESIDEKFRKIPKLRALPFLGHGPGGLL